MVILYKDYDEKKSIEKDCGENGSLLNDECICKNGYTGKLCTISESQKLKEFASQQQDDEGCRQRESKNFGTCEISKKDGVDFVKMNCSENRYGNWCSEKCDSPLATYTPGYATNAAGEYDSVASCKCKAIHQFQSSDIKDCIKGYPCKDGYSGADCSHNCNGGVWDDTLGECNCSALGFGLDKSDCIGCAEGHVLSEDEKCQKIAKGNIKFCGRSNGKGGTESCVTLDACQMVNLGCTQTGKHNGAFAPEYKLNWGSHCQWGGVSQLPEGFEMKAYGADNNQCQGSFEKIKDANCDSNCSNPPWDCGPNCGGNSVKCSMKVELSPNYVCES